MIMIIIVHDESMDKGCSVNIFPCRWWWCSLPFRSYNWKAKLLYPSKIN